MTPAARAAATQLAEVLLELGPTGTPCRRGDLGDWFREGRVTDDDAAALCAGCPAARSCLDYALTADERWGVWGGTTAERRRQEKARSSPATTAKAAA